jgi:GH24 family phage-related lysozyme (muramidase)
MQSGVTKYLPRAAAFDSQFVDLKAAAGLVAQTAIAKRKYKSTVQLAQADFDALVSFTFNVGVANFASSTLLKKINLNAQMAGPSAGRKAAADAIQAEFAKWNKSSGMAYLERCRDLAW